MVWIMSLVGLVILLLSGDLLVRGAVNLSLRLGCRADCFLNYCGIWNLCTRIVDCDQRRG